MKTRFVVLAASVSLAAETSARPALLGPRGEGKMRFESTT